MDERIDDFWIMKMFLWHFYCYSHCYLHRRNNQMFFVFLHFLHFTYIFYFFFNLGAWMLGTNSSYCYEIWPSLALCSSFFSGFVLPQYLLSAYPTINNTLLGIGVNMQQLESAEQICYTDKQTNQKCRLSQEVDD